jgi:hypothetical protein
MIENAINLVNATIPILEILSEHGIGISAFIAIITLFVVVGEMFYRRYLQKKQHEHENEIERSRQEHDKRAAKEQIIKHLKRFIQTEENDMFKIEDRHQEKIAEVRNDFQKTLMDLDKNRIVFPENILEELLAFTDKIRDLSKQRLVQSGARGRNPDMEKEQIQIREDKGNKLVKEAKEFIEKLEK